MIRKILKIKNYGIFRDFVWESALKEFDKINLFYGLNGSGKSTFTTLFDDIKNKEQRYFLGEFKVSDDEVGAFASDNLENQNYNIYVFDSHFIEDNIGEFSKLKGIVYLSESNKTAKEALEQLREERKKLVGKQISANKIYEVAKKNLDNAFISIAKRIKEEFHVIGGVANIYSNYTKATFQQAITRYQQFLSEQHDLSEILQKIDLLKNGLKDEVKDLILDFSEYDFEKLAEALNNASHILNTTLKSRIQEKISDEIFTWLEEGYRLHNGDAHCKYCGNYISSERQQYLDDLFNTELQDLQTQIIQMQYRLENSLLPEINIPESAFYLNLRSSATNILANINKSKLHINEFIQQMLFRLKDKQKNPFDPIQISNNIDVEFALYRESADELKSLICSNNEITKQFSDKQLSTIKEIEKFLVYSNYFSWDIISLDSALKKATKDFKDIEAQITLLDSEIAKCENDLIDVLKASSNFNDLLSKFLGRNELALQYDSTTKGYKIIRKESGSNAQFLSEGEKTAIAFVYFLTKVKENGNDIENSTIVFDDPISSFDSNHLFNAYAFIETYFNKCKQLFVLTHNFQFFKLLRKKYKKEASMYLIESRYTVVNDVKTRNATIINLPKSIKQASSEYDYLFEKIYNFHKNYTSDTEIEFDDYMQMANTCRKIVESFASFKIYNVSDLSQKLVSLYKCNRPIGYALTADEQNECEKIYRFINAFSHFDVFEDCGETDIIFGELDSIVASVLSLIERADKDHYNALIKSITS